jgi:hypothetical protein
MLTTGFYEAFNLGLPDFRTFFLCSIAMEVSYDLISSYCVLECSILLFIFSFGRCM